MWKALCAWVDRRREQHVRDRLIGCQESGREGALWALRSSFCFQHYSFLPPSVSLGFPLASPLSIIRPLLIKKKKKRRESLTAAEGNLVCKTALILTQLHSLSTSKATSVCSKARLSFHIKLHFPIFSSIPDIVRDLCRVSISDCASLCSNILSGEWMVKMYS